MNDFNKENYDSDDTCDLNITKICNSCGECLELGKNDYRIVRVDGLAEEDIDIDEYILEDNTLNDDSNKEENDMLDEEYIEDIPELREEYDKKINKLLGRE